MILGMGIDLVDLKRIKQWTTEPYVSRVLSESEKIIYQQINDEKTKLAYIGGRFAAKEAIFKAISKGEGTTNYKDFSILNDESGKPYVISNHFPTNQAVHITITHTEDYAIAYCVIEKKESHSIEQ